MVTEQPTLHMVEQGKPLEESVLWRWMKEFYADGGVAVWSGGDVPFHITNTPAMAEDWANAIFACLRDLHASDCLDPEHPITIVELGPGTGRLAYYLLGQMDRLERQTSILYPHGYRFCLQLAELGRRGVRSLARHPQFRAPLAEGRLRLSLFDADGDEWPTRFRKKDKPPLLPSPNPVFVIANYFLDSLAHDIVHIRKGVGYRAITDVGVHGLKSGDDPRKGKNLADRIELKFRYPHERCRYSNPLWNKILDEYEGACEDSHIPFPTVSLRLAERMRAWSEQATVLLVADKSFTKLDQLENLDEPELVAHGGGFSFNANVQAINRYAELCGGMAGHTSCRDGTLDLSLAVFPAVGKVLELPFPETELMLEQLESFNSVDRFRIREALEEKIPAPDLRLCLDSIRLSAYDPQTLYELSDHMLGELEEDNELDEETEAEVMRCLYLCLERTFPVGDDIDVCFEIGRLAYRMEDYELAQIAFELSIHRYGKDPKAFFNIGLGWFYRREWERAEAAFEEALALDSGYADAETWLTKTRVAAARS